jgi:hypothetical protein
MWLEDVDFPIRKLVWIHIQILVRVVVGQNFFTFKGDKWELRYEGRRYEMKWGLSYILSLD